MVKKGDTLIEVTLAIGIFSMIAIAVVSIMNGGTSGTQTALETTLAREEIDAQAEALRFIHASYIADKGNSKDSRFQKLWEEITKRAVSARTSVTEYSPSTCADIYNNGSLSNNKAFILNTRALNNFTKTTYNSVLVTENGLKEAKTYPRILYNDNQSGNSLIEDANIASHSTFYRAEGIFIEAVKDAGTTNIISNSSDSETKSAFFDFYIRTCWYGSGMSNPSTISTVIRLYDPDAITDIDGEMISFNSNGGKGYMSPIFIPAGRSRTLPTNSFRYGDVDASLYSFVGWSKGQFIDQDFIDNSFLGRGVNGTYFDADTYTVDASISNRKAVTLYAVWDVEKMWVDVNLVLDGVTYNSGDSRFKVKAYVNDIYMDPANNQESGVAINDHDFYIPANYGSKIRVDLYETPGFTLDKSSESLCGFINSDPKNRCVVRTNSEYTTVEFIVNSIPEGTAINSSGKYAINVFPHWTTNPPEGS